MIANKDENLSLPLQTQNFEADDFVFFTSSFDEGSYSYGGQALGEDITGFPGLSILFSEANLDIESNGITNNQQNAFFLTLSYELKKGTNTFTPLYPQ